MKKLFFLLCMLFSFSSIAGNSVPKDYSNGVLLVRLNSGSKQLDFYKEKYPDKVKQFESAVNAENEELIQAFSENYNYSKVLFFYSDDAEAIKNKKYTSSLFTADMKPIQEFKYSKQEVFIARIGSTLESTLAIATLVLYDAEFDQLERPFPYYVRTYEGLSFLERSKKNLVTRLNKKLLRFKKSKN